MKTAIGLFLSLLLCLFCLVLAAAAKTGDAKDKGKDASTPAVSHSAEYDAMRLEGEKRYHSNCGRCHAAPPKFAPRMMATIVRHMRVRSTITDQDMHLILRYMTQ